MNLEGPCEGKLKAGVSLSSELVDRAQCILCKLVKSSTQDDFTLMEPPLLPMAGAMPVQHYLIPTGTLEEDM